MSKFVVCPACEGEGTTDTFGAFTSADLDEWYGDSYERDEFVSAYRAGDIGRKRCDWCNGKRVVPAVDEDGISAEDSYLEDVQYRAMVAAEMRYTGDY